MIKNVNFIHLYNILQDDLYNIIKGCKYLNVKNKDIKKEIYKIERINSYNIKIPLLIEIQKENIKIDLVNDLLLNELKKQFLDNMLYTQ